MKRITGLALALVLALGLLSGCGDKPAADLDLKKLSDELSGAGVFSDLLSPLDLPTAAMLYSIDEADLAEAVLCCSTGATAEEIALFKASSEDAAGRIAEAAAKRLEHQKASYESYVPAEVPKLDAAVVVESGLYVLLCVSEDAAAARELIESYI